MRIFVGGRVLALALIPGLVGLSQTPAKQTATPEKRRIAVFEFDNTVHSTAPNPYAILQGPAPDVGKAAADLLITKLVQDGSVVVIERDALNKVLAEQNLTNSDRTDPRTAAKLGRILGVDAIVLGSVTRYDFANKTSRSGGRPGFMGLGASSPKIKQELNAHVEINARVVSPDTAQVLTVSQGQGTIDRSEKMDYSEISNLMMGKGELHDSMMSQATDNAVSQLAAELEKSLPEIPVHAVVIDGLVADASDSGRLILNVGSSGGAKVGDHVQIWRSGKEIRDPATGRVLTRDDTLVGDAVIVSVENAFSVATYKGTQPVKVGDVVKGPVKPQ
ncbi:MAG TPA: CsgG/HfaB family protein [Bryobacteraceae bacterium]|nr:CsgG/HfaB family protein [Bryobacteraceae bacterium]